MLPVSSAVACTLPLAFTVPSSITACRSVEMSFTATPKPIAASPDPVNAPDKDRMADWPPLPPGSPTLSVTLLALTLLLSIVAWLPAPNAIQFQANDPAKAAVSLAAPAMATLLICCALVAIRLTLPAFALPILISALRIDALALAELWL